MFASARTFSDNVCLLNEKKKFSIAMLPLPRVVQNPKYTIITGILVYDMFCYTLGKTS